MVNIQSPTAEIRRGKKEEEEEEEERRNSMKILWSALLHRATIIKRSVSMTPNIGLPAADSHISLLYIVGDAAIPLLAFPFPKTTGFVSYSSIAG